MELINYAIEVATCLAVLYALYFLFLRGTTFHQINRFVIIVSVISSFAVPLMEFEASAPLVNEIRYVNINSKVENVAEVVGTPVLISKEATDIQMHPYHIFFYVYFASVLLGLSRYLYSNIKIWMLFYRANMTTVDGKKIYILDRDISPFTYCNKILLSRSVFESAARDAVIAHELTHAKQWHNIDIHLMQILKAFQILNPFFYLFERDLKAIHEYIADSGASKATESKSEYLNSLLDITMGANVATLANSFNGIKLIKRIKMMDKKKSSGTSALKYMLLLPVIASLFFVFACDSGTSFKTWDNSAYETPDKYAVSEFDIMSEEILSRLNLTDEWASGDKVAKFSVHYEIDENGEIGEPYFTNAKYADDESWKNQSIDAEMEAQIMKVIRDISPKYTPAIKNGKPIKSLHNFHIIVGDKQKWYAYNASGTVMTKLPYADHRIGYDNPAEKAPFGKMGLPVLSHKQCNKIPKLIQYPEEAKAEKLDADVELSFEVDNKGNAQNIQVEKSAGELFDQSAVTAIATLGGFSPNQTFNGEKRLPITIKFQYGTDF